MEPGHLMGTAARLSTSLEALAALAAHLRVESEGLDAVPRVRELLGAIATELLGEDADATGSATSSWPRSRATAYADAREAERTWNAPVRLFAGRQPA